MFSNSVTNWLNRHDVVQYLFVLFPFLMAVVYCPFFLFDLSGVLSVLQNNNDITKDNMSYNMIKEVESYSVVTDDTYDVVVSGSDSETLDIRYEDLIYTLMYVDEGYYMIAVSNGSVLYTSHTDLDDGAGYKYGDIIAEVYLDSEDKFRIERGNGVVEKLDALNSVDVLLETEEGCRLDIDAGYSIELKDAQINFCTNLPTDGLYYNEYTLTLVRNIDDSFQWMFLFKENIWFLLGCMLIYTFLLMILPGRDKLSIMSNQHYLMVDLCAVVMVVWHGLIAIILF